MGNSWRGPQRQTSCGARGRSCGSVVGSVGVEVVVQFVCWWLCGLASQLFLIGQFLLAIRLLRKLMLLLLWVCVGWWELLLLLARVLVREFCVVVVQDVALVGSRVVRLVRVPIQ